ncbi:MAG: uroporphyrinogen decarboxylase family protein [Promethearchaeia archaeon]
MVPSPIDIINTTISHEEPERVPVLPLVGLLSARLSNESTLELLRNPDVQARALLHSMQQFDYDGVFTVMDLTVEAEALGAEIEYTSDRFPYVSAHPLTDLSEVSDLSIYSAEKNRLSVFVEVTRKLRQNIGTTHLVSSYVVGPFTLAGQLFGVGTILERTVDDSESVKACIQDCALLLEPYVNDLIEAGAHNIVILEPTASNNVISPEYFEEYCSPYVRNMIESIKSQGAIATLHICGDTNRIIGNMCDTGANALSIDSAVDLVQAKKVARSRSTILGNVDTTLLLRGTSHEVMNAAKECLEAASNNGGFILSSGCDFPIETPPKNLKALVQAANARAA